MSTRYVFTSDTIIYHPNGLRIRKSLLPSDNAIKYFINGILADVFVKANPRRKHRCSATCGKPIQLMIGYPHSFDVASSVPGIGEKVIK